MPEYPYPMDNLSDLKELYVIERAHVEDDLQCGIACGNLHLFGHDGREEFYKDGSRTLPTVEDIAGAFCKNKGNKLTIMQGKAQRSYSCKGTALTKEEAKSYLDGNIEIYKRKGQEMMGTLKSKEVKE